MNETSDSVVLIDAFSQIFRAFFAVRALTNSRGEPVNAVYVFTRLLLSLDKNYPSRQGAMLFDCGKVRFRLALAPDYKANRPPMPPELALQMEPLHRIAGLFGWPQLQHEDYEADDLIGALALHTDKKVWIVSSDKDLSQLIDDRVQMLIPASGGFTIRGAGEVCEKFGVPPSAIADYLALIGDSADNIPGVPGVGPKGAAELLNLAGSLENFWAHPELAAQCRAGKKLAGAEELLRKNLQLVRLRTELPDSFVSAGESLLERKVPDWPGIAAFCRDLGLPSILKMLPPEAFAADTVAPAPAPDHDPASAKANADELIQGELF